MNQIHAIWAAADGLERFTLLTFLVASLAQTVFVVIYATRPFYKVRIGRALMLKSASLCVVLWLSLVSAFFTYPHEREVSAVTVCVITAAILYQLAALLLSPRNPYG